jgi:hypothetical protein
MADWRQSKKTIATGTSQVYEYQLEVADGLHWFEGRSSLLPATDNTGPYVIWVSRNITLRKQAEIDLQRGKAILQAAMESFPSFSGWRIPRSAALCTKPGHARSARQCCRQRPRRAWHA